jgi:hypothetical protein
MRRAYLARDRSAGQGPPCLTRHLNGANSPCQFGPGAGNEMLGRPNSTTRSRVQQRRLALPEHSPHQREGGHGSDNHQCPSNRAPLFAGQLACGQQADAAPSMPRVIAISMMSDRFSRFSFVDIYHLVADLCVTQRRCGITKLHQLYRWSTSRSETSRDPGCRIRDPGPGIHRFED